jgi:hypothetical protein
MIPNGCISHTKKDLKTECFDAHGEIIKSGDWVLFPYFKNIYLGIIVRITLRYLIIVFHDKYQYIEIKVKSTNIRKTTKEKNVATGLLTLEDFLTMKRKLDIL